MGRLQAKTYFRAFMLLEMNVPDYKLVSITTDGAPAMTNENSGFIGHCIKDPTFLDIFSYHKPQCHQEALYTKMTDSQSVTHIVQETKSVLCLFNIHSSNIL
jgi:hypothetical protein